MKPIIVICNCKQEEASDIARAIIERKVAACVNIISNIRSFYMWEGALCDEQESTLIIKTSDDALDSLKEFIVAVHSYDVPEIIALDTLDVLDAYKEWMMSCIMV